ncbi:MAG: class I SAM-dependent methyltransferase [Planctomycetota bacterium]
MLREIAHFFRHAPGVAVMSTRMSQAELFHLLSERADEAGVAAWRARLVEGLEDLTGEVLEIGCGTGLMFRHYPPGLNVVATEYAPDFLGHAFVAAEASRANITLELADAEALAFESERFDVVVVSAVLCSVTSPKQALSEIRRVLKPGGEVRLMEHVRSPRPVPGALMHLVNPLWRLYNRQGCNLNRNTKETLIAEGYEIMDCESFQVFARGLPAFPSLLMRARPK